MNKYKIIGFLYSLPILIFGILNQIYSPFISLLITLNLVAVFVTEAFVFDDRMDFTNIKLSTILSVMVLSYTMTTDYKKLFVIFTITHVVTSVIQYNALTSRKHSTGFDIPVYVEKGPDVLGAQPAS